MLHCCCNKQQLGHCAPTRKKTFAHNAFCLQLFAARKIWRRTGSAKIYFLSKERSSRSCAFLLLYRSPRKVSLFFLFLWCPYSHLLSSFVAQKCASLFCHSHQTSIFCARAERCWFPRGCRAARFGQVRKWVGRGEAKSGSEGVFAVR